MLAPGQCFLYGPQPRRPGCLVPLARAAQERDVERRGIDHPHIVATELRGFDVGLGQGVAQVASGGIRVALQDQNALWRRGAMMASLRDWRLDLRQAAASSL